MVGELKNQKRTDSYIAPVVKLKSSVWTNHEVVSGLRAGDPRAAEALVDRFGVSIDRRVWRLLGADEEHDDVVQLVYAQILQSIGTLRDAEALADWICTVTVNVVRNELRSRKYKRIVEFREDPAMDLVDVSTPEERLFLLRGYKILQRMKVEHRIVFIMRFIEGAELTQVARATGCSLATAKRRIKRSREIFMKRAEQDSILAGLIGQGAGDEQQ